MSSKLIIPDGYYSKLSQKDTQKAIKFIKDTFQKKLSEMLNLDRVTAPVIIESDQGVNDDLNGVERKVAFEIGDTGIKAEVVQSLAKWKRIALYKYGYSQDKGIYTDMNAIRRDDDLDNTHSIFVDQWDWERVITEQERNIEFLKKIVTKIVEAICYTKTKVNDKYLQLTYNLSSDVFFISSQELEDMYPNMSSKEREDAITKLHKTVFIMQIGKTLKSGKKHDGRAPDYDDWELNGDILFWDDVLGHALEISSMGIRVDAKSLKTQLELCNATDRMKFTYHKMIADQTLPLTVGGGIGQSRLCMLLLEKAHVGEVQVSVWPKDMRESCEKGNINLL